MKSKKHLKLFTLLLSVILWSTNTLQANSYKIPDTTKTLSSDRLVEKYLLPSNHRLQSTLKKLFQNPNLFESPLTMQEANFDVLARVHRGLMVARHPLLKNYLIKKFVNSVSQKIQLENYIRRIEGARALAKFIETNRLKYIVVPKKWLYRLPESFNKTANEPTYVLIVEKMDICNGGKDPNDEIAQRYINIKKHILKELCLVLFTFNGLDSVLPNLPFTKNGKIAFIDTERWETIREGFLPHITPFLDEKRRKYVNDRYEKLSHKI